MFSDLIPNNIDGFAAQNAALAEPQDLTAPLMRRQTAPTFSVTPFVPPTVAPPMPKAASPAPATAPAPSSSSTPAPAVNPATPTSALDAWQTFYNSPAFQVPLNEGLKAVNTKYAGMGALESGAAMKAIDQYGADHASSALSGYLDDLYRQEALGEGASSALAGVGQNMVNQVSANNNNAASAAGNAALVGGNSAASNINNIGSAIGTAAGGIAGALGSSFGTIPKPNLNAPMSVNLPPANPVASMQGFR